MSGSEHRQCGPCTKCCEGWLSASIKGHRMYPGRHCHFLAGGKCTVYDDRPSTCRDYNCAWKVDRTFPEWMRPDLCGFIITRMTNPMRPELDRYEVTAAGGRLTVESLNWLVQWALDSGVNLSYEIDGKYHAVGSHEFRQAMRD